jgi:hypothetical protein
MSPEVSSQGMMQKTLAGLGVAIALIVGVMVGFFLFSGKPPDRDVVFPSTFQAVLLTNGAVYFGKLQGYGTPHPVMTDVYYIVTQTDPETKKSSNVLVKRGKELHGPDRMYLNANQILFVEPVGSGSKVAQLISDSR